MIDPSAKKVSWFRTATPYLAAHRGECFVLSISEKTFTSDNFLPLTQDIVRLHLLGIHVLIVHDIDIQAHLGNEAPFKGNRRRYIATKEEMLIAQDKAGSARLKLEAIFSAELPEISTLQIRVISGNYVTARPLGVQNGVNFQFNGEVRRIDSERIKSELRQDGLIVLSPIGFSPSGESYLLDVDKLAVEVSVRIKATKLLFLSHTSPLHHSDGRFIRELTLNRAKKLREMLTKEIDEGYPYQLDHAIKATESGVKRAHLLDSRIDGALPLELFTRDGIGTMVYTDPYDDTRRATGLDVTKIQALIRPLEQQGVLVPRTVEHLDTNIDKFVVMERDGALIACAALYPYAREKTLELACVVVHEAYRSGDRGNALLRWVEEEAINLGMEKIFVLTTQTADWFRERGFYSGEIESLPTTRQSTYDIERGSTVLFKTLKQLRGC